MDQVALTGMRMEAEALKKNLGAVIIPPREWYFSPTSAGKRDLPPLKKQGGKEGVVLHQKTTAGLVIPGKWHAPFHKTGPKQFPCRSGEKTAEGLVMGKK